MGILDDRAFLSRQITGRWRFVPYLVIGLMGVAVVLLVNCNGELKRANDIADANTRAALDTTRTSLRDSILARTRLASQREIERDSLGEALQLALGDRRATLRTLSRTRISFDSLQEVGRVPDIDTVLVTPAGDSLRTAVFAHEGPPIEGEQVVTVASQGGPIELESHLAVTPFTLTYGIACADHDAVVSWDTPQWVNADFVEGVVDPQICNPKRDGFVVSLAKPTLGKAIWMGAGAVICYFACPRSEATSTIIINDQRNPMLNLGFVRITF